MEEVSQTELAQALERTAQYIQEHGWRKGRYESASGAVCLIGGLHRAVFGTSYYNRGASASHCDALFLTAYRNLMAEIGQSPEYFNDDIAKEEVDVLNYIERTRKRVLA